MASAGFGYSYYVERLKGYGEVSGAMSAIINQPLIHQPGETWEYSVSYSVVWACLPFPLRSNTQIDQSGLGGHFDRARLRHEA